MRVVNRGVRTFGAVTALLGTALAGQMGSAMAQTAATPPAPPVKITGNVEVNYTANFNQPFNNTNTYLYNNREGQFSLNLADLHITKDATPDSRMGFVIRPIAGEVARTNFNAIDHVGLTDGVAILEGYGTLLMPMHGKDVKVDVGQFVTHVGYETIEVGTNNFFSRNFLFQYPSPFYDAGVRAAFPVSPKTTITGYLYNRYNGTNDPGNRDIAPGFQIAYNPSAATGIIFNGLTSRENIGTVNKQQSVLDLIATHQFGPSFKGVFEGLYRFGKDASDNSYNFPGAALYGIFTLKNGNTFALRGEYMSQSNSTGPVLAYPIATNDKPNVGSATASYELHSGLFPGVRTLLEYRYDFAGKEFFPGKDINTYKKNQSSITIGQVYSF